MAAPDRHYDLVVVGAGFNGLMAAKVFRQLNPGASVIIYDSNVTIGGVWAQDRLYPHLKTNNMLGTYEYPDFPTASLPLNVKPGQYMSGHAVHHYLSLFADKHALHPLIEFNSSLQTAECLGKDGWLLSITQNQSTRTTVQTRKLIMATGVTSEPRIPHFTGQADYKGVLFHGKDLAKIDPVAKGLKDVVVFGGTKMAWDAVYHFAVAGIKVHWVIRKSGHGPAWMAPSFVTPLKLFMESLVMTRAMTWLSPCVWASETGLEGFMRSFLHRTWLGQKIVDGFFHIMSEELIEFGGFHRTSETAKLIPWVSPFWIGAGRGIITSYERNFTELVTSGIVDIHIGELSHLSAKQVHMADGTTLSADAIASCTGWKHKPTTRFLPEGIEAGLGIPSGSSGEKGDMSTERGLDSHILNSFPRLRNQPPAPGGGAGKTQDSGSSGEGQFNLYRFIAPPAPYLHHHSLAFCGYMQTLATPVIATIQAIWIAAYFSDALGHINEENDSTIAHDRLLHSRFGRWRYPWGMATRFPDFVFDAIPYFDLLLKDLGLRSDRKTLTAEEETGWLNKMTLGLYGRVTHLFRNTFTPYYRADYAGLVEEWQAKHLKTT